MGMGMGMGIGDGRWEMGGGEVAYVCVCNRVNNINKIKTKNKTHVCAPSINSQ